MKRVNPITGVEHTACATGWTPEMYSHRVNGVNYDSTITVCVDDLISNKLAFHDRMKAVARGLSEITNRKIEWRSMSWRDNPAQYGDFGFFLVHHK